MVKNFGYSCNIRSNVPTPILAIYQRKSFIIKIEGHLHKGYYKIKWSFSQIRMLRYIFISKKILPYSQKMYHYQKLSHNPKTIFFTKVLTEKNFKMYFFGMGKGGGRNHTFTSVLRAMISLSKVSFIGFKMGHLHYPPHL